MSAPSCDLEAALKYNPPQPFSLEDVESIEAEWKEDADEPAYCVLVRLKDGRWAAGSGSHDYTGWDCQSSFSATIHTTRDEAIRLGLTLNDRENLGLLLPGEAVSP